MTQALPISAAAPAAAEIAGRERLRETAQDFEAIFIAQMLRALTDGLDGEGPLGGGEGDPFRGMLGDEIAKLISRSGGVGIADAILKEMLKMQEVA
jgi:peptidoglycan hydrolase FlgJ